MTVADVQAVERAIFAELDGEAQARGRVWTSYPFVFGTAYGDNAALRTPFSVELLRIPNWGWTDRTMALRRSVQQVTVNTFSMGNSEAFYAVYVEAWGAPVRKAYDAALEVYGYSRGAGPLLAPLDKAGPSIASLTVPPRRRIAG